MATGETHNKLKQIKQSFHLFMNGITAQSMREKGAEYKVNWGIDLINLRKIAKEYVKDYDLAIALWKENSRECKILATYIMPAEKINADIVYLWLEQIPTQEIAELLSFNLLRNIDFAPSLAYQCLASDKSLYQICGFQTLACLFADGKEPNERGINEFLDQAEVALNGNNLAVKQAAYRCVMRFCDLGSHYHELAKHALKSFTF